MTRKLLTVEDFKDSANDGARPDATVMRFGVADPQAVDGVARTMRFVFSDGSVDRAGDRIDPKGWSIDNFKRNPVALWSHDSVSPPIGRAFNVGTVGDKFMGDIEFMTPEISPFADSIYEMVRAKFINAVSVGFLPLEWVFVSEKDRPYGIDFKRQELLEISVCPVPCNAGALAEARSMGIDTTPIREWAEKMLDFGVESVLVPRALLEETFKMAKTPHGVRRQYLKTADWKVGASRDLPLDDSDSWDGPAAEASIFAHAGGDDFDPAKARGGFLVYDASAPKLRGSYKLPFATASGGGLKAVKGGIRAAASRLPQADISDGARTSARSVIDHYEKRFGMDKPSDDGKSKAEGEGTGSGGGDTVGVGGPDSGGVGNGILPRGKCGRAKEEECGMSDPQECSIHAKSADGGDGVPPGHCGRSKDEACGLKNPQECAVHFTPPDGMDGKRMKAGRRISAANKTLLERAITHHESASECIRGVLNSNDAAGDDPDEDPDSDDDDKKSAAPKKTIMILRNPEEESKERIKEVAELLGSLTE